MANTTTLNKPADDAKAAVELDAPLTLTPEQIATVAAGAAKLPSVAGGGTRGYAPVMQ